MQTFIRVSVAAQNSSKRATAKRCRGTEQAWPVDLKVAGVTLAMTDEGARELIEQLQRALAKRA